MDVQCVDFSWLYRRDRPGKRFPGDEVIETFTLERCDGLRVGQMRNVAPRVEDDGAGNNRTGQAPPADFVATGDAIEPPAPHGVFEGPHRANANHAESRRS